MKDKVIRCRIDEKLLSRFESALDREGLTKTQVLINAVHEFVTKSESRKDVSKMEKFKVYASDYFKGNPVLEGIPAEETHDETEAIELAKKLSSAQNEPVYIFFNREYDGQTGFLNPDGYDPVNAVSWND